MAQQHKLGREAVRNHREKHVPKALGRARAAREVAVADNLLEQVCMLRDEALAILGKAEAADDHGTALRAIREARATVELLAKLAGELDERTVVNVANVFAGPEWGAVQALVMRVLAPHPEARMRFVEGLHKIEGAGSG